MNYERNSLTTSNISSTEVYKYSYDNSRYIISDISFTVDGTVFDWFNIDFTGVKACIGLSYEAMSFSSVFVPPPWKECFVL